MIDNKYVIENLLKLELKDIFALEFGARSSQFHSQDGCGLVQDKPPHSAGAAA